LLKKRFYGGGSRREGKKELTSTSFLLSTTERVWLIIIDSEIRGNID
jgi:hypothetical protein